MSTGNLNKNSKSIKKAIRFEHELIEEIEQVKHSLIPFSAWVKAACEEKVKREKGGVVTSEQKKVQVRTTSIVNTGNAPLNGKNNRDEIQALTFELKEQGHTNQEISDHFNNLGYLTGTMKPFSRDSVHSLIRYTGNLKEKKKIDL